MYRVDSRLAVSAIFLSGFVAALVLIGAPPAGAALPGANGRIVFEANIESGNFEVYSMNPDGSDRVNLTNSPGFDGTPTWSPDGTHIAFRSDRSSDGGLYIMGADGSNPTLVSPSVCITNYPAWSPDGSKIAFTGCAEDDVYVVNVDGTGLTDLTNTAAFDDQPAWSPDGSRIAYRRYDAANSTDDIWVMNADGSNQTDLTNSPTRDDVNPDWSPDGSRIAYTSGSDIFVMNPDGSDQTNLTMTTSTFEGEPAWAPDGTRVAFSVCTNAYTRCDIWTMASDGSDRVDLTSDIAGDVLSEWAHWQPLPIQADHLNLDVFWGPYWHRTLAYTNGGTLTSGDLDVSPATGDPIGITGTGTIPSRVSGDATVAFNVSFDAIARRWTGTLTINDPAAGFSAYIPIHSGGHGVIRSGTLTRGTLWGYKQQSEPRKCFMILFEIDDLG